MSLYTWFAC